ncbi:hypothetical protein Ahy_B08g093034 [Arachis hypogaea]|uniref:Protein FAR1-RELATED SEQUENCE n=1 Tax=Arachis hypogaea TaxID=3818 RepID=A0A444Y552_ARAHY|nr:hypothetical protein Ahy_B08g093034 [Arachis hypogaea]
MSHVVWNSFTKESFDRNWNDFLMKYGLTDVTFSDWIFMCFACVVEVPTCMTFGGFGSDLVYLDHHFWTGMRSTQRSESMHIFFNKYDNFLGSKEQRERERKRIGCCRFSYCHTVYNKIINGSSISACVYLKRSSGKPKHNLEEMFLTQYLTSLELHMMGYQVKLNVNAYYLS